MTSTQTSTQTSTEVGLSELRSSAKFMRRIVQELLITGEPEDRINLLESQRELEALESLIETEVARKKQHLRVLDAKINELMAHDEPNESGESYEARKHELSTAMSEFDEIRSALIQHH